MDNSSTRYTSSLSWKSGENTGFAAIYSDVRTLLTTADWTKSVSVNDVVEETDIEPKASREELKSYIKTNGTELQSLLRTAMSDDGETVEKQGHKVLQVLDEHVALPVVKGQVNKILSAVSIETILKPSEQHLLLRLFSNDIDGGAGVSRRTKWMDYRREEHKKEYLMFLLLAIRGDPAYVGELNSAENAALQAINGL